MRRSVSHPLLGTVLGILTAAGMARADQLQLIRLVPKDGETAVAHIRYVYDSSHGNPVNVAALPVRHGDSRGFGYRPGTIEQQGGGIVQVEIDVFDDGPALSDQVEL